MLLDLGGGRSLNVWNNGTFGAAPVDDGVAVVTSETVLDCVEGGVSVAAVPEPTPDAMLAAGLLAVAAVRRRAARCRNRGRGRR